MTTAYQTLMQQQRNAEPFGGATAQIDAMRAARLAAYRAALASHDWTYEMSDDHSAYCEGRRQRQALEAMQPDLDPGRVIWNSRGKA